MNFIKNVFVCLLLRDIKFDRSHATGSLASFVPSKKALKPLEYAICTVHEVAAVDCRRKEQRQAPYSNR